MTEWSESQKFWEDISPWMFRKKAWQSAGKQVDQVVELLKLPTEASILDMCCGPGRHALELARRGYQVTGVDIAQYYIRQAVDRAATERLDIKFVIGDMRVYNRPGFFDVVLNLSTSFGGFIEDIDNKRALQSMSNSLKPGGQLLLEILNKDYLVDNLITHASQEEDGMTIESNLSYDDEKSLLRIRHVLSMDGIEKDLELVYRLYNSTEIAEMLDECGFSSFVFHGGMDGRKLRKDSNQLVVVGWK